MRIRFALCTLPVMPFPWNESQPLRSRFALTIALLALVNCAAPQHPRAPESPVHIEGTVSLKSAEASAPRGNLALYWLLPGEVRPHPTEPSRRVPSGFKALRNLLSRVVAFPEVELGRSAVKFHLEAPREALVFALFDTHGRTFDELLEGGGAGDWMGSAPVASGKGSIDLALTPLPPAPASKEACHGERDRLEIIDAPEVAGTQGNDTRRRLCVHLPLDYETKPERRYPVVYVLPGLSGQDSGGSVGLVFHAGDEAPIEHAAIFVGVNIATKSGASYLVNSPLSGDFDKLLSQTIPAFIDGKYRTLARSSARALVGQSTGGFGAVSLALRHGDRFGTLAVSSPDGLDLGSWLLQADGKHMVPLALDLLRIEEAFGPPGQMSSYAADWSPDPKSRFGFRWPANPQTGAIIPEVWATWQAQSPSELIKQPALLARARANLSGKLYFAAGTADEFDLFAPTKRFSDELTALGVGNVFVADGDGHSGTLARRRGMVTFVLDHLEHLQGGSR